MTPGRVVIKMARSVRFKQIAGTATGTQELEGRAEQRWSPDGVVLSEVRRRTLPLAARNPTQTIGALHGGSLMVVPEPAWVWGSFAVLRILSYLW